MKFRSIAFVIVIVFSIVGALLSMNAVHELTHKYNLRNVVKSNEEICVLTIPTSNLNNWLNNKIAYYKFDSNQDTSEMTTFSEVQAYAIGTLLIIIFIICLVSVIYNWRRKQYELL